MWRPSADIVGAMGAVRVVVADVDSSIAAFAATGYTVAERWGPPFAILTGDGPDLWVSGPGTSAAQASAALGPDLARPAAVRLVLEVDDRAAEVQRLVTAGWTALGDPVSGPGGSQQLVGRGDVVLEVFASA